MVRSTAVTLLVGFSSAAFAQDSDGTLTINSSVDGAQIYIDNELRGETPYSADMTTGVHTVRVSADGYDPFVREIEVMLGEETTLQADLSPGVGTVEFLSNARGAVVTMGSGQQWSLPVRLSPDELAFGTYSYTVSAPTYQDSTGDISFSAGENIFVFSQLESNTGRISVNSTPTEATVFIDGESVGQTPLSLSDYAPGVYQVRLEQDRHALVFRTLDTTDGDIGDIEARLPENGARLVVKTGDPSAEVSIEGQVIGTGSTVTIPELERRQYQLQVSAPGQKVAEARIDVPSRGRLIYTVNFEQEGSSVASQLINTPPLTRRWTFWTATGLGAAAVATGGALLYVALQPDPVPSGDVVVTLP